MPTKFERAILDAAVSAQEFHIEMTGGQYLWESHESFLQNYIAFRFAKFDAKGRFRRNGYCVYIDSSPRRIRKGLRNAYPGKTPKSRNRFDLVFWFKSKDEVKAILEIKRAWMKSPIESDIEKVTDFLSKAMARNIAAGYVLYYTDCRSNRDTVITKRFDEIAGVSGCRLVDCCVKGSGADHRWGVALYRCAKPS